MGDTRRALRAAASAAAGVGAALALTGCEARAPAAPDQATPLPERLAAIGWAYARAPAAPVADDRVFSLDGSTERLTGAQVKDRMRAVDWFPSAHPPAPAAVREGQRPGAWACGYCHLPDGNGRPENAALAGLPAAYIADQVANMRSGARFVEPSWFPSWGMHQVASLATPADAQAAADYFSRLPYRSKVKVIEAADIPAVRVDGYGYAFTGGAGREPLGERIVEAPESLARFTARDNRVVYMTYVPPGSVARGQALAATGGGKTLVCASCHGEGLKGGVGPPLAGRFPGYMFRQLDLFQKRSRNGPLDVQMHPVAAKLTRRDMIDLAAYAGSLQP